MKYAILWVIGLAAVCFTLGVVSSKWITKMIEERRASKKDAAFTDVVISREQEHVTT